MSHYVVDEECPQEVVVPNHISRKMKAFDKNLMLVEVDFKDGAVGTEHVHPHEQISYCVDGIFDYSIEGKVYRLKKGDSIFVPENLLHGCKLISQTGKLLDIFTPYREDFVKEKN